MKISYICRAFACTLALTAPTAGYSDDTDIFFNAADPDADVPEPLVMLSLDLRPNNITAGYCTLYADCEQVLGEKINAKLEQVNEDWNWGSAPSPASTRYAPSTPRFSTSSRASRSA